MTDSDFFEVRNEDNEILHVKLKGFWSKTDAETEGERLIQKFESVVDSFESKDFITLADLSEFGTPTIETKAVIAKCMKYALDHGMYKSIQVINRSVTKMSIDKTAQKVSSKDFRIVVTSLEEANDLIAEIRTDKLT
ncbi:hypothetical protein [Reichenbachiella versicolor]|uniref:hypothetical protein n=1 Tax=Reichenbachiella versicolor TaxID=1821036 RepID=UPI000D6E7B67|nr:hypothetical protein [Reichenbachiella versicolor]